MRIKLFFLFICIFLSIKNISGQNEHFSFRHLTTNDGLSNATILCTFQDSKGFMWIGTTEGLNRYDGYEFIVYKNIPEDTLSLCNNRVECVVEDSNNNLWVGASDGLHLFNREQNNFTRFVSEPDKNSLTNNYIREIIEDDGCFWITTIGGGVNHYDYKNNKFTHYWYDSTKTDLPGFDWVWTVFKDSQNRLWFGTMDEGLNFLNRKTGKFTNYKFKDDNPAINTIRCIYEIANNDFFIGTDAGLVRFSPEKGEQNIIKYEHNKNLNTSISKGSVRQIFKDNTGNLWFATQLGLDLYNAKQDNFSHIKYDKNNKFSISSDEVWDIFQDNQGLVWFGTFKGGINILNIKQNYFTHWRHNPLDSKTLINSSVVSFAENEDNTLWIGIDHGGLCLFDKHKGTLKTYIHNPDINQCLSSNSVLSLLIDSKKQLWTGSWAGGLTLFDKSNEQFIPYIPPDNFINGLHVWDIIEDYKGRIWFATYGSGVSCYNTTTQTFATYTHNEKDQNSLSHDIVWTFLEDSRKELWIGTISGLNKYNEKTNDFTYYPYIIDTKTVLSNYTVYSIFEDSNNKLWVSVSGNGLNLFDIDKKTFKPFTEDDGIVNNLIYGILEDGHNNLWLSTDKGITKIGFDANDNIVEVNNFDKTNGLYEDQFNRGASFKSSTGEMFFGSANGLIFFNPDSIKPNTHKPKVFITDFRIFNKKVPIDAEGKTTSPLRKEISETREITLTHKQSVFSLKFTALSFISSQKNQYAYKLEGFDKEWNYVNNKREATYTNLDAGEYTFRVKASNNDGLWNEEDTKLMITILPPWWNTWWFKAMVIILIVGGAISFYKIRINAIKAQKVILENTVTERTNSLQELNITLEERQEEIMQQTDELASTNNKLATTNEQLAVTNNKLEVTNDTLADTIQELTEKNLHIKSSINYAQKLQNAILPIKTEIDKHFENFILYRPKDIVSGDFYWFHELPEEKTNNAKHNPKVLIAAADCTGHGVPGAIMSMIGNNLLNEAVLYMKLINPVNILNHVNEGIIKALKQDTSNNDDGMDVCLCLIEKQQSTDCKITFCGAKRPLIYYKHNNQSLNTIKGNVKTVGGRYTGKLTYSSEEIIAQKNDILYLTSDGYADQCNEKRKGFGMKRLRNLIHENAKLPIDKQKLKLETALDNYKQLAKQRDDITILGIKL